MKAILYTMKPPCPRCPYKLGLVHTIVNPCPQCKENGYKTYEQFKNGLSGKYTKEAENVDQNEKGANGTDCGLLENPCQV